MIIIDEQGNKREYTFGGATAGYLAKEIKITFDELFSLRSEEKTIDYINTTLGSRLSRDGKITIQFENEMPEPKRWRLEFPEEDIQVKKCQVEDLNSWLDHDGLKCELRDGFYYFSQGTNFAHDSFLSKFLVEIREDKLMTVEDY